MIKCLRNLKNALFSHLTLSGAFILISQNLMATPVCEQIFLKVTTPETTYTAPTYNLALENGFPNFRAIRFGGTLKKTSLPDSIIFDIYKILKQTDIHIIVDRAYHKHLKASHYDFTPYESRITFEKYDAVDLWQRDWSKPLVDGTMIIPKFREPFVKDHYSRNDYLPFVYKYRPFNLLPKTSELPFEGGDLVVGNRHIFMGATTMRLAQERYPDKTQDEILEIYKTQFGKDFVLLDTDYSGKLSEFHTDLKLSVVFNTKTQQEEIFLSSPVKFFELITGERLPRKFLREDVLDLIRKAKKSKNKMTISDPSVSEAIFDYFFKNTDIFWLKGYLRNFFRTKSQLEKLNYTVHEVPGMLFNKRPSNGIYHLGYTNMVLGKGYALLGTYGVYEFEYYVHDLLARAGYEPVWLKSAVDLSRCSGGFRCATEAYYQEPR